MQEKRKGPNTDEHWLKEKDWAQIRNESLNKTFIRLRFMRDFNQIMEQVGITSMHSKVVD